MPDAGRKHPILRFQSPSTIAILTQFDTPVLGAQVNGFLATACFDPLLESTPTFGIVWVLQCIHT